MSGSPTKAMRFPVYQIDFSAVASGKRVAATKRRIRWRFGFPNQQALDAGRTGIDTRGEEHEVVVVWSITSGKRQVLMDGREVNYSSSRAGVLDFSWTTRGNHVLKVLCHAALPMTPTPNFRQYDFFVDGQSFFTFPKVYELGIRGAADRGAPRLAAGYSSASAGQGYDDGQGFAAPPIRVPRTAEEEEAELQRAINASLAESRNHLGEGNSAPPPPEPATADLLDFGGDNTPAPAEALVSYGGPAQTPYGYAPPPQTNQPVYGQPTYGQPPPPPSAYGQPPQQAYPALMPPEPAAYGAHPPPPPQQAYGQQPMYGQPQPPPQYGAPPPPHQEYYAAPPPQTEDPFVPKPPSYMDATSEILKGYGDSTTLSYNNTNYNNNNYPPSQASNGYGGGGGPNMTMESMPSYDDPSQNYLVNESESNVGSLTMGSLAVTEEEPTNPFDAVLKKLVNIDRIDEPAEVEYKLTMKKEEERKKGKNGKSVPKPPAAQGLVGSSATLAQISSVKPATKPKEDIMKAPPQLWHPDAAHAGALVVHGQGPPPLGHQGGMVGFGVGYNPHAAQMYGSAPMQYGGHPQQAYNMYPPPPHHHQQQPQGYGYR